ARRRLRCHGGAGGRAVRHRDLRSAGLRALPQGRRSRAARLWPDGAPRRSVGGARWLPVRCLVQPSRAAGGVERADRLRTAPSASRGTHRVHVRRRPRPPGASALARDGVPEGAADPGAIEARMPRQTRPSTIAAALSGVLALLVWVALTATLADLV